MSQARVTAELVKVKMVYGLDFVPNTFNGTTVYSTTYVVSLLNIAFVM